MIQQVKEKRKLIQEKSNSNKSESCLEIITSGREQIIEKLRLITKLASEKALKEGQPILAALSHLIKYDINGAIIKFLRMNQVIYAYLLAKLFDSELITIVNSRILRRAIIYKNQKMVEDLAAPAHCVVIKAIYFGQKYLAKDLLTIEGISACSSEILLPIIEQNIEKAGQILIATAKEIIKNKRIELFECLVDQMKLFKYFNLRFYCNSSLKK